MRTLRLSFTDVETKAEKRMIAEFADDEVALLERFLTYCDELAACQWVRDGMQLKFTIRWKEGTAPTVDGDFPSRENLSALLHHFRPFGLQNEETYFYKVCKLLDRKFAPTMKDMTDVLRRKFAGDEMQSMMKVSSNGITINSEETLNTWLNAFEYHRDAEKRSYLEELHKLMPLEVSRALFVSLLVDRTQAVFDLAKVIGVMIERRDSLDVKLRRDAGSEEKT